MAYTDDAVKAKLSALNETQEGIVSCSQWIMFHRRHADRTAQLWMQRLKESTPSKKLNLIYLANEVVQQSKARKKGEFVVAYSPIIAEATAIAYKGATNDVQQKLKRVVEVWRQRQIFDLPIQEAIESRVDELDRTRTTAKKATLGGSLFSSSGSAPPELQPLVSLQNALTRAEVASRPATTNAISEYDKITDPSASVPTSPVQAARLNALLKTLATAEGAVAESMKARRALISGLEKLLETNRAALASEETEQMEIGMKKTHIEARKREVEDCIMRGLSAETMPQPTSAGELEPERPDFEALTPPLVESLTPVGSPTPESAEFSSLRTTTGADTFPEERPVHHLEPRPNVDQLLPLVNMESRLGADLLASLAPAKSPVRARPRAASINGAESHDPRKRRKLGSGGAAIEDFAGFATEDVMDGIDDDVAEMLGRE